jgi:hypothetical protein
MLMGSAECQNYFATSVVCSMITVVNSEQAATAEANSEEEDADSNASWREENVRSSDSNDSWRSEDHERMMRKAGEREARQQQDGIASEFCESNEEKQHDEMPIVEPLSVEQVKMLFSGDIEEKANSGNGAPSARANWMTEIQQAEQWCELAEAKKIAARILMDEADTLLWKAMAVYQRQIISFVSAPAGEGKAP